MGGSWPSSVQGGHQGDIRDSSQKDEDGASTPGSRLVSSPLQPCEHSSELLRLGPVWTSRPRPHDVTPVTGWEGRREAGEPAGGSELHASWASWVQRRRKAVRPQDGYLCAAKGCFTPLARLQRGVYQLAERKGKDKQRAKARRPRRGIVSLQASIQLAGWEFGIAHHRGAVRIDPGPPRWGPTQVGARIGECGRRD